MTENINQKDRITIGWLTSWAFGLLFLFGTLGIVQPANREMGFASLLIACFLLPPIRQFIHARTGRTLSTGLRVIVTLAVLIAGVASLPRPAPSTPTSIKVVQSALPTPSIDSKRPENTVKDSAIEHEDKEPQIAVAAPAPPTVQPPPTKQPSPFTSEANLSPAENFEQYGAGLGMNMCQKFIKDQLVSPQSASFPLLKTVSGTIRDGDTVTVKAPIEAENLYGNVVHANYVCKVRFINYGDGGVELKELTFSNPTIVKP